MFPNALVFSARSSVQGTKACHKLTLNAPSRLTDLMKWPIARRTFNDRFVHRYTEPELFLKTTIGSVFLLSFTSFLIFMTLTFVQFNFNIELKIHAEYA